jgi:hypothetical protein
MHRMGVMRTGKIGKRGPVLAVGRRVKRTLRAGLVSVVMYTGHKSVTGGIVMILGFEMRQIVLCLLRYRAHPAEEFAFFCV